MEISHLINNKKHYKLNTMLKEINNRFCRKCKNIYELSCFSYKNKKTRQMHVECNNCLCLNIPVKINHKSTLIYFD